MIPGPEPIPFSLVQLLEQIMSVLKTQSCSFLNFSLRLKALFPGAPQYRWLWKVEGVWGV